MSFERPQAREASLFNDPSFPDLTISKFVAIQLKIPTDNVIDNLYRALPLEKQTVVNKQLIEKAVNFKVNASGAIILMINTNEGLQLIYGNSQRRKKVVSSNGSCEEKESMADTAIREFSEEIGNPQEKGILSRVVKNIKNSRSVEITNKIGRTCEEIANRIIEQQADKNKLYINMSSLYANDTPVNIRALTHEIESLNEKLKKSAPYYNPAVILIFGDRNAGIAPANLSDPTSKEEACKLINNFKENCQGNITSSFSRIFALNFDEKTDSSAIKEALSAIIDLTENNEIGLISKTELESLLSLDLNQQEIKEQFKKEYFSPSFENIVAHKGKHSPNEFLNNLEKLSSQVNKIGSGVLNSANVSPAANPTDTVTTKQQDVIGHQGPR